MPQSSTPNPTHVQNNSTSNAKSPSPSRNMAASAKATPDPLNRAKSVRNANGSPLSARGSVRRPAHASRSESGAGTEDSKAETTALIDDLKEQLRKAEIASEEYQKQAAVLQSKLDEALGDHDRLQETAQNHISRVEALEKETRDSARRFRDLESAFENEKVSSMKAHEDALSKEQELSDTVQRLRESLASRDKRGSVEGESLLSRATSIRGRTSPNPKSPDSHNVEPRDSSQNNAKLVHQKDKIIESLRLELAEAQIKNVELENAGGGKTQELEKKLLEARMSNAKLLEDNESYQVLLQERTLNGSFGKSAFLDPSDSHSDRPPPTPNTPSLKPVSGSLADELNDDNITDDNTDDKYRKLEADLSAQKDQNKALTLYINKIITRLLQNETFEQLFENGSITDGPLKSPVPPVETAAPVPKAEEVNAESARKEVAGQTNAPSSFLQRAGSIFGGRQRGRPARPKSIQPPQGASTSPEPNAKTPIAAVNPISPNLPEPSQHNLPAMGTHLAIPNENPDSAPSIPLRRSGSNRGHARVPSMRSSHRRSTSDWNVGAAAGIVNNMHRTPSSGNGLQSPTGLASPRQTSATLFPQQSAPPPLILEDAERSPEVDGANRADVASDSGYGESVMSQATSADASASPRAAAAAALEGKPLPPVPNLNRTETSRSEENKAAASGPASWFSGPAKKEEKGGMRPLRLVQEKNEADAERKKANRTSFMGWFQKGTSPPQAGALASPPPLGGHSRSVSTMPTMGGFGGPGPSFERESSTENERPGSQH
ncbi:MAG: hypothetical protein Q9159_005517 [Coniocarpon cinnabarinum]